MGIRYAMELVLDYPRNQAIKEGLLVDVSEFAHELGYTRHTAVSGEVWDRFVDFSLDDSCQLEQCEERGRRIRDLLRASRSPIEILRDDPVRWLFTHPVDEPNEEFFQAICGRGDDGEAVLTILVSGED